jgi:hypothetical protein
MDEEDDISLAGIDVPILEQKNSIHAIILKNRELDEEADRACEIFAHN